MVYPALPEKNKPKEIVVFQCGYTTIALETANVFQSCPSHDRYLTHVSLPGDLTQAAHYPTPIFRGLKGLLAFHINAITCRAGKYKHYSVWNMRLFSIRGNDSGGEKCVSQFRMHIPGRRNTLTCSDSYRGEH
ncbi:hypothetical protein [Prolixibacter denitrificans]|uniref:hypothetical protein n=1 Tax=Prolixibacter denitrificans TaxID=1541063 RepID=UPI0011B1D741|nr:hypothetical protein [Prolixibacter denitrificans]